MERKKEIFFERLDGYFNSMFKQDEMIVGLLLKVLEKAPQTIDFSQYNTIREYNSILYSSFKGLEINMFGMTDFSVIFLHLSEIRMMLEKNAEVNDNLLKRNEISNNVLLKMKAFMEFQYYNIMNVKSMYYYIYDYVHNNEFLSDFVICANDLVRTMRESNKKRIDLNIPGELKEFINSYMNETVVHSKTQNRLSGVQEEVKALNKNLVEKGDKIAELMKENDKFMRERDLWKSKFVQLDEQHEDLSCEYMDKDRMVRDLTEQLKKANEMIIELKKNTDMQKEQMVKITENHAVLIEQLNKIEKDRKAKRDSVNTKINKHLSELKLYDLIDDKKNAKPNPLKGGKLKRMGTFCLTKSKFKLPTNKKNIF